jgi:hypothetical protein
MVLRTLGEFVEMIHAVSGRWATRFDAVVA